MHDGSARSIADDADQMSADEMVVELERPFDRKRAVVPDCTSRAAVRVENPDLLPAASAAELLLFGVQTGGVARESLRNRTGEGKPSCVEQQACLTQLPHNGEVMAHEEHRPSTGGDILHFAETLRLERGIPHGEDLVYEQDLRLEMGG